MDLLTKCVIKTVKPQEVLLKTLALETTIWNNYFILLQIDASFPKICIKRMKLEKQIGFQENLIDGRLVKHFMLQKRFRHFFYFKVVENYAVIIVPLNDLKCFSIM